jgi:hypothetical protein
MLKFFPDSPVHDVVEYFVSYLDLYSLFGSTYKLKKILGSYHGKPHTHGPAMGWPHRNKYWPAQRFVLSRELPKSS